MAPTTNRNNPSLPQAGTLGTSLQFCTRFQISRTTFWRWSQTPGFPVAVRFGRTARWPVEAVEAFLTSQQEA